MLLQNILCNAKQPIQWKYFHLSSSNVTLLISEIQLFFIPYLLQKLFTCIKYQRGNFERYCIYFIKERMRFGMRPMKSLP